MERPAAGRLIYAIARREVTELTRSRRFLVLSVGVPLFLFFLFAYAMFPEVKNISFAVLDLDRTSESRDYIEAYRQSGYFKLRGLAASYGELERRLAEGELRAAIVIPEKFGRKLAGAERAEVQALIDGTVPSTATVIEGYLEGVNAEYGRRLLEDYLEAHFQIRPEDATPVMVEDRVWYNRSLRTTEFVVPGLLAIILMFYPVMLATLAVTREKESGAILNIYSSPVQGWHYFVGKLSPYAAFSLGLYLVMFFFAVWWFAVPFRGSFLFLTVASALYILSTVGLGIVFALALRTQAAAVLAAAILTIVPSFIFSGFFMPVRLLPAETQVESHLFPVMYYMTIVRAVFLKGVGLEVLWPQVGFLILYGLGVFAACLALFRKQG